MAAPAHIARENGKKGGRPKGKKNAKTLEKDRVMDALRQRTLKAADKLLNIQLIAATGTHKMVVVGKDSQGKLTARAVKEGKEMQNLLDTGEYGKDYLIVAATEPDWKAADAMLNRTFGKPKETIELEGAKKILVDF